MDRVSAGRRVGRYELREELARGAMGTVFSARDREGGRLVALKVMTTSLATTPEEEKEFLARFEREARIAASLKHPGIVQVHDVGSVPAEGLTYIAMELVEGETLRDRLVAQGHVPEQEAIHVARVLAEALAHAHGKGIVHRDVKPSNVLLGRGGEVRLTDFGIARVPASDLTRTGVHVGTPNFMAPEQVKGRTADARSDIFSLGVMLYWMATGKRPFGDDDPARVAYRTVNVLPVPPHEVRPEISRELSAVISKALEKDPARRYQSAADMAAALLALETPMPPPTPKPAPAAGDPTATQALPRGIAAAAAAPRGVGPAALVAATLLAFVMGALGAVTALRALGPPAAVPPRPSPGDAAIQQAWDLGVSYYRAGRLEDAAAQFETILAKDPSHGPAQRHLELVRGQLAAGQLQGDPPPPTGAAALPTPAPTEPADLPPVDPGAVDAAEGATTEAPSPAPPPATLAAPAAGTAPPLPLPPARDGRLGLTLSHRLEEGTVEVIVDGAVMGSMSLEGKRKPFRGVRGEASAEIKVPSGRHAITVRVRGRRDDAPVSVEKTTAAIDIQPGVPTPLALELDKDGALILDPARSRP